MFFKNYGPFKLEFLIKKTQFLISKVYPDYLISDISNLKNAKKNDLTFFDNLHYLSDLKSSNASYCLIKKNHLNLLPKRIIPIHSTNPLLDFILIALNFYPDACYDNMNFKSLNKKEINKKIKYFSENLVIGKNVKLGKNISIGHNSIIKDHCVIGNNVQIGSNCVISNSIIEDNTEISDNTIIGKKGFGFKKIKNKIQFIPHIGKVLIGKNCFIGSCVTIDRGSFSDTVIEENTFIDNHVQIAHNVKIGKYCFFASQSGIAGSSKVGDNCLVGGQAGISGHLNIGNNVKIAGGSGVIKSLKDNQKVMGYPAVDFRYFIKEKINVNK